MDKAFTTQPENNTSEICPQRRLPSTWMWNVQYIIGTYEWQANLKNFRLINMINSLQMLEWRKRYNAKIRWWTKLSQHNQKIILQAQRRWAQRRLGSTSRDVEGKHFGNSDYIWLIGHSNVWAQRRGLNVSLGSTSWAQRRWAQRRLGSTSHRAFTTEKFW